MALQVYQFPCRTDNYGFLAHDPDLGVTACIDTPEEGPINAALEEKGWRLTHILNTHHHGDHTGANMALKGRWGCTIVGAASGRLDPKTGRLIRYQTPIEFVPARRDNDS